MSWRIFRKKKKDRLIKKCEICHKSYEENDLILEFHYQGYRESELRRFHAHCMIKKLNSYNSFKDLIEE